MANTAYYVMVVKGDNDKIRKFIEEAREETDYLFYDFDGDDIKYSDGKAVIYDGARWSVWSSTLIEHFGSDDYSNSWIIKKSKDYGLAIRYRGYETGCCFTEDFEVVNGEVRIDDCETIEVDVTYDDENFYDWWDDKEFELSDWIWEIDYESEAK